MDHGDLARRAAERRLSTLRVHALVDSLRSGGAEFLLSQFAAAAPRADIEVSVGYLSAAAGFEAGDRLRAAGVEPTLVGALRPLSPVDVGRVRAHLRAVAPDLVHTHLGYADALGGLAARSLGLPAVSTLHQTEFTGDQHDRRKERWFALVRRRCDRRIVAVSDAARDAYLATGWDRPERVVRVHNGLASTPAPGAGAAIRSELGLAPGDVVAGMTCVPRPRMGHLEAVTALASLEPHVKLLVLGEGPAIADVRRAAGPLGDRVVLAGYRSDVMACLDAMDLLLQPSLTDALPTTLIEAMAAGVPVIASAVGGIPELVVDGETGMLLGAPPDPETLANAIAGLVADPRTRARMGAAARERFARRFSATAWASATRAVYDEVLAGR